MYETIEKIKEHFPISQFEMENIERYAPLIRTSAVPLSFTGVNARTFFAWKQNGLVDLTILKKEDENGRKWIKLNLYEFVWIKMVQNMRDFGLPYEIIKSVKNELETKNYLLIGQYLEGAEKYWRENTDYSDEKIVELKELFSKFSDILCITYDEDDPYEQQKTILFDIIIKTIQLKSKSSILIVKDNNEFKAKYVFYDGVEVLQPYILPTIRKPHFEIPLLEIIEDFFNEPKSVQYGEELGLIDQKEKKVLEALRKNDFIELHIKLDQDNDLIIESINDGSITDEQATQVRKILGLNQYEEITLKYRNNKNLYFRNKKRIG
jgi:hypothetical protein